MTAHPLVSVVVPLYNKSAYVEQAVASALDAFPRVHEVIVVDDGSTDDGPQKVRQMHDPRIRLLQQKNRGVSAARNHGIREARGDFIAFLDADDYWTPNYMPQIHTLIAAYPDCDIFATHYFTFTDEGITGMPRLYAISRHDKPQLVTHFFEAWSKGNFFYTCSVVVRRTSFFQHNIFFPENESLGEDQDVWFRLAEKSPVAYSARPLVAYRIGIEGSLSKKSLDGMPPFIQRLNERYNAGRIPPQHRKGVARILGLHRLSLAMKYLRRNRLSGWSRGVALLFDPFSIQLPKFWLKIFMLACLPRPLRLYVIEKL